MLTVYGCPTTRSVRVVWLLEELGLDYEYRYVDLRAGEHRREPFVTLNPFARVPLLVDGEIVISESRAICDWLADKHPEAGLVPPAGTPARARHEQWSTFAVCELEQPLWTRAKHEFALPEKYRVPAVLETAAWEFRRAARVLDRALAGCDYLCGDAFSSADILAAHTLNWARNRLGPLQSDTLDSYLDRQLARPALARARAREEAGAGA